MIDKENILDFMRVNDISQSSSQDDIRKALSVAGWHKTDVDVAMSKLNDENEPYKASEHEARNIFYSDKPIASETLSTLLGIDVAIPGTHSYVHGDPSSNESAHTSTYVVLSIFLSVVIGLALVLFVMYLYNIGPFYTPVEHFRL